MKVCKKTLAMFKKIILMIPTLIMKRKVKLATLILVIVSLSLSLSACGKVEKEIVGMWYDSDGDVLNVQKDGTYNYEGEYGTGTWKILDDKETIEFKDFYGSTKNIEIIEDDSGVYIIYHQKHLYKDAYPSDKNSSNKKNDSNNKEGLFGDFASQNSNSKSKELDAFDGISYEVSGISPYCKVAINTQNCDDLVQRYVTFRLDKETYANGETAIISATLSPYTGDETYELKSTSMEYKIAGLPEYVESIDDIDLSLLKSELADFVVAQKGQALGSQFVFGYNNTYITASVDSVKEDNVSYFSSLKKIKKDVFDDTKIYNSFHNLYSIKVTDRNDTTRTIYISITAHNLVKNTDGSIRWGTKNLEDYDFVCKSSGESLEDCVTVNIMSNSENYNISKVTLK